MYIPDDDVLNVLNSNTQNNNYNQGSSSDDELKILNENTQSLPAQQSGNKYGIGLTDDENAAREAGYLDSRSGVIHTPQSEIDYANKNLNAQETESDGTGGQVRKRTAEELGLGEGHVNDDGTVNYTATSSASLDSDKESINTVELYRDMLGRSKFIELKRLCGLADNDSFTDFYNRTHYIPKGYEMEVRLALAEERRMKLYGQYQAGELSETDFLYQAYGKDLLKEQGYDLESKLFWYNRHKQGDYTNPLDNELFLSDLIANAREIFEDETWIKETQNKTLATSLAGLVSTGTKLSNDKVYDIFKTQIDALSESFNNDINKVITYYQAGTLNGVFNPFIDIDADGKYDYYYHLDGKMYAVAGSSGVGDSTVDIEYNDDGTVHSIEVNDGLEGWFGGLLEGFRDFWVGFVDVFAMVGSLFAGIGDAANGGKYWVDSQQRWEAWKKEWLSQEDRVVFDSHKRGEDWGYEISKGIGTVAGMVVLTVATWGIGTAISGAGTAASAGASAGANAAAAGSTATTTAGLQASLQSALQNYGQQVAKETGKQLTKTMVNEFTRSFMKAAVKQSSGAITKAMASEVLKTVGTSSAKLAASHVAVNALKATSYVGKAVTGARNGTFGGASEFTKRTVPILFTAVRDAVSTWGQLEAQNQVLDYLSKQEGSDITPLSEGEILGRAIGLGAADFAISSMLRLQGEYGLTNSKIGLNPVGWFANSDTAARSILNASSKMSKQQMNKLMSLMARSAVIDNIADVAENMLTAGVQAALANPYAKIGSGESWTSFARGMTSPQVLITSVYQTLQNVKTFGAWSESTIDSRMKNLIGEYQGNTAALTESIQRIITKISNDKSLDNETVQKRVNALSGIINQINDILNRTEVDGKSVSYLDNVLEATKLYDQIFDKNTDVDVIATAFGLISKEQVQDLQATVEYLNANKAADEPEYGYATAYMFNNANGRTAEEMIRSMNNLYKIASEDQTYKASVWKRLASPFSFRKGTALTDGNNMYNMLKNFVKKVDAQKGINIQINDVNWQNYFICERLSLASDIDNITDEELNKLTEGEDPIIKFHYNEAASIIRNTPILERQSDGTYKAIFKGKPADLPFIELIIKAYEGDDFSKKQLQELEKLGLLQHSLNEKGQVVASFLDENHPMAGVEFDRAQRNEMLSNKFIRDVKFAYDFFEYLSNNKDLLGETMLNFDIPLIKKVILKSATSDNPDAVREIYYFPLGENETSLQQIVNRFHAVSMLVSDYMKVMSGTATQMEKATMENIFIRMHLLSNENTSTNDLYAKLTKLQDELQDDNKRQELLDEAIPHVTAMLLSRSQFFIAQDGTKLSDADAISRAQLLTLWNKGIITEKTLTDIASGSVKMGANQQSVRIAKEFLSYVTTLDKITKVMDMLGTTFLGKGDVETKHLTLTQQDMLRDLVTTLNDPNNKALKDTLMEDKRISKIIEDISNNPQAYSTFFRGFGKDGRVQTQESISAILENVEKNNVEYDNLRSFLSDLFDEKVYKIQDRNISFQSAINSYINDKLKVRGFRGTSLINADKLPLFLADPVKYISDLTESDFYFRGANVEDKIDAAKKEILDSFPRYEDGTINIDQLGAEILGFKTIEDVYQYILETPDDENILLDYLRLDSGNLIGDIDYDELDFNADKNEITYKGENLMRKILSSSKISGQIAMDVKEETIDKIFDLLQTHMKLIYQGTEFTKAQNVLEINLIELLPNDLNKLFSLFRQQQEALNKFTTKGKIDEQNLKREMIRILTGTGSGNLAYQDREYKKLLKRAILNDKLIMRFDLNNKNEMNLAKNLLTRLGYDDDLFRLENHESIIPGIIYKNTNTHNIKTKIDSKLFFDTLNKYVNITPIHSKGYIGDSYRYLLKDLLSNVVQFDDNTEINLRPDGEILKLYGYARSNLKSKLSDGLFQKESSTKHGLLGGELSQILNYYIDSLSFDGDVDEQTRTTFNVIKVIDKLTKYVEGEYSAKGLVEDISIPLSGNSKLSDEIDRFYEGDKSLYLYILDKEKSTNTNKVFKLNPFKSKEHPDGFDIKEYMKHISVNGFDIKNLIPVWSAVVSHKTHDFDFNKEVSFETPFSVISQIDGFRTVDEVLDKSLSPIEILSVDTDEYSSIFTENTYTVAQLKEKLASLSDSQKNNYFVRMLQQYIDVGEASYKALESSGKGAGLVKFAHPVIIELAGKMLDEQRYEPLLNKQGVYDSALLSQFVNELNEKIKSPEWQWKYEYNTDLVNFDDEVTSSDILKLNGVNKDVVINEVDVANLLKVLRGTTNSLTRRLDSSIDLIAHNPLISAMQTFLDVDDEGHLTIAMEYFKQATVDDRIEFLNTLRTIEEDESLDDYFRKDIENLANTILNKNDLITDLNGNYTVSKELSDLDTQLAYENLSTRNPSVSFNPSLYFSSGALSNEQKERIVNLIANKLFVKTPANYFITSSSIDYNNSEIDPLNRWYIDFINKTAYRATDKQGSIIVSNLNTKEGIAELFDTIVSFKDAMLSINDETGILKGINDPQLESILYELGLKANAYSSGVTYDSEYAGALILKYNTKYDPNQPESSTNRHYEIVPLITSSSDKDKDLLYSILKQDYKTEGYDKYIMLSLSKNAFKFNISGFDGRTELFDLNDEETLVKLHEYAYKRAYENTSHFQDLINSVMTPEEVVIDYYKPHLTYHGLYQNLEKTATSFGMSQATIQTLFPMIESINVRNPASLTETQVQTYVAEFISNAEQYLDESVQFENFKEAVLFNINRFSLSDNAKLQLENYSNSVLRQREDTELLTGMVGRILDREDVTTLSRDVNDLSNEQKVALVKKLLTTRQSGKDLAAIFNTIDGTSLKQYMESITVDDDISAFDYLTKRHAFYDTEFLYKDGTDEKVFYEFAIDINDPYKDDASYLSSSKKELTILVASAFTGENIQNFLHSESDDSFTHKINYVNGTERAPANYIIVKDFNDLVKTLERLVADVDVMVAYNSRAEGSDNSFFKDIAPSKLKKLLDESIDAREDIFHKTYSTVSGDDGRELPLEHREAFDDFRRLGYIDIKNTTEAHTGSSDNKDLKELSLKIRNNKVNTGNLYKQLENELRPLLGDSFDDVVSKIDFSDMKFNNKYDVELIDSVKLSSGKFKRGNTVIKQMFDAYNVISETQNRAIQNKKFNRILMSAISPFDGDETDMYLKSMSVSERRFGVQNIFLSLMKQVNADSLNLGDKRSYRIALGVMHDAMKKFADQYKAEHPQYSFAETSNENMFKRFLSLDTDELLKYVKKARPEFADYMESHPITDDERNSFNKLDKNELFKFVSTTEYGKPSTELTDEGASLAYRFKKSIIEPVMDSFLGAFGNGTFAQSVLSDLLKVYGMSDRAKQNLAKYVDSTAKVDLSSRMSEETFGAIKSLFSDELYSQIAAYQMFYEKANYVSATKKGDPIENGTVYIGRKQWAELYPDAKYGDEFYTKVWRQPGQTKTVMHVLKVKLIDEDTFYMTRDTAKSYFNGDFDGDFYYIGKPADEDQVFGKTMWEFNNVSANFINKVFGGLSWGDTSMNNEYMLDMIFKYGKDLFTDEDILRSFKNAVDSTSESDINNFNKLLSDKVDSYFTKHKIKFSNDDSRKKAINMFVSTLGLTRHTPTSTGSAYVTSSNFFIKDIASMKDTFDKLDEGNRLLKANDLLHSDFDSSVIGQIAKQLSGEYYEGKASEILFNSMFTMTEESMNFLDGLLSQNYSTKKREKIKERIISVLNQYKSRVNGEIDASIDKIISNVEKFEKRDINSRDILYIAQVLQTLVQNTDTYNRTTADVLKETIKPENEKLREKIRLLNDYAIKTKSGTSIYSKDDINAMNGPQLTIAASKILGDMVDMRMVRDNRFSNKDNAGLSNLFNSVLIKANLFESSKNGMHTISNSERVANAGNNIGIGDVIVGVRTDDKETDSGYVVDVKKYDHKQQDHYINTSLDISLKNLTDNQREQLRAVVAVGKSLTGKELNRILKPANKFINDRVYIIDGIVNGFKEPTTSITDHSHLIIRTRQSLYDAANMQVLKGGMVNTKALKASLGAGIELKKYEEGFIPTMLFGKNLFNTKNLSIYNSVEDLDRVVETNEGTYKLYRVSDYTILNVSDIETQNVGNRNLDWVSLIQGSHGADAAYNMANFYYSVAADGTITYDPTGINQLRQAMIRSGRPMYQDVNASNIVMLSRIALELQQIKDPTRLQTILQAIAPNDTRGFRLNQVLQALYKYGDLGGKYGASIENRVRKFLNDDELSSLQRAIANDNNHLAKVMFSQEVNDMLGTRDLLSSESVGEPSARKKVNTSTNQKALKGQWKTTNDRFVSDIEGSLYDTNGLNFVPRATILRMLLESQGQFYNRGFIMDLINNGLISTEDIVDGNRLNNYNPIIKGQGIGYDGPSVQTNVHQKSGSPIDERISYDISENETVLDVIRKSMFDNGGNVLNNKIYRDAQENVNGGKEYRAQKYLAPFLMNGTLEDVFSAENNFRTRTKIVDTRATASLNEDNSDIVLNTAWNVEEAPDIYTARKELNDIIKSPKYMTIKNKLESLTLEDLNAHGISYQEYIGMLDAKSEYVLKSDSEQMEILQRIMEANEDSFETDMGNLAIKNVDISELMKGVDLDKVTAEMIKISCGENQIEFQNSWLSGSGLKAKDGMDIGIGTEILRQSQIIESFMKKYLGNEFATLQYITAKDKALFAKFNAFMNMEKNIQIYDELTINAKEHKTRLGNKRYEQALNAVIGKITNGNSTTVEAVKTFQRNLFAKNDSLTVMVKYARQINARLLEQAKKLDPYAICGWFIPTSESPVSMRKFGEDKYINAYNAYHENIDKVINGDIKGEGQLKFATLLQDSELGYVGSVLKAAKQLAETQALTYLTDYAKSKGFMRNVEIYSNANDFLSEELDGFIASFSNLDNDRLADSEELNRETFNRLKFVATELGIDDGSIGDYVNPQSFVDFLNFVRTADFKARESIGYESLGQLEKLIRESQYTNKDELIKASKINNLYQSTLAVMTNIMCENTGKTINEFLLKLYNYVENKTKNFSDFTLVDDRGAKLNKENNYVPMYQFENPIDGLMRHFKYGLDEKGDARKIAIARMMIQGDVYLMRNSLADQLEEKVFTKEIPTYLHETLKVAKNIATTAIMSAPTMALNSWFNFPIFDTGVVLNADFGAAKYLKTSINALNKLAFTYENLTQEQIDADPNLQYAIRFVFTTNQDLIKGESVRGEKTSAGMNIPLLKQYLKASNFMYNIGNMIPRFAYWLDLVKSAEANGYKINPKKSGVAFHLMKGIREVEGNRDITDIYNRITKENPDYDPTKPESETNQKFIVDEEKAQASANIDAQAAAIVAEHNGLEGNMPYLSRRLSQKFNTMFLAFPMQLLRWGKNRIQSLGYAVTHINVDDDARGYLVRQLGSVLAAQSLLLALQIAMSKDTQEYLGLWGKKKKEEQTEEERENATNILWRGGCIKLFDTIIKGEETTTPHHSRGPSLALFDSYIADFIPQFNKNFNEDGFFKTLWNKFKEKTLGHTNFIIKDVIESIPGNKEIQSTSWAEPGDNFWENYGRKILAYSMGYTQANNFVDYMKSTDTTGESNLWNRLKNGMAYAYTKNYANTKENKSEYRNYKKAFTVLYNYKNLYKEPSADGAVLTSDSNSYKDIKDDFQLAIKTQSSPSAVYAIVEKYMQKGISISTIRSALRSCSLRYQINNVTDQQHFLRNLTSAEKNTVKSALAYEDENYGFLDDILDDLDYQYRLASNKNNSGYTNYNRQIANILRNRSYNIPRIYRNNRYYVPRSYLNLVNNFINNVNYKNRYRNYSTNNGPLDAFNQMQQAQAYGTSRDVWGNEQRHYTDGTTYNVRQPGMPFPGGNK